MMMFISIILLCHVMIIIFKMIFSNKVICNNYLLLFNIFAFAMIMLIVLFDAVAAMLS